MKWNKNVKFERNKLHKTFPIRRNKRQLNPISNLFRSPDKFIEATFTTM